MSPSIVSTSIAGVLVALVAVGVLAGPAAALDQGSDDASPLAGSSLEVDVTVESPATSGDGTTDCAGDPVGDHTCDKEGTLTAGPVGFGYEGFNDGNAAGGPYAFGDDVDVEAGGQSLGLAVTCEFESSPSASNPCPADPTTP